LEDGVHGNLRKVIYIQTKVASDRVDNIVDNVEVCPNAAACPWTSELPYVISDWIDTHVRMDCFDDFAFWCNFPENMLPTPFVSSPSEGSQASDTVLHPDGGLCGQPLCMQPNAAVEAEFEAEPEADA